MDEQQRGLLQRSHCPLGLSLSPPSDRPAAAAATAVHPRRCRHAEPNARWQCCYCNCCCSRPLLRRNHAQHARPGHPEPLSQPAARRRRHNQRQHGIDPRHRQHGDCQWQRQQQRQWQLLSVALRTRGRGTGCSGPVSLRIPAAQPASSLHLDVLFSLAHGRRCDLTGRNACIGRTHAIHARPTGLLSELCAARRGDLE